MELYNIIAQTPPIWLKGYGNDVDIVMCSRIRLARNIEGFLFPGRANQEENAKTLEYISCRMQNVQDLQDYCYFSLKTMPEKDLYVLFERHLISKEHLKSSMPRGVFLKKDESVSIMINEEDHLRIQVMHSGLHIQELWEEINALDDLLDEHLPYCFHEKYGYLTACPSNTGTGLRISVMLHLPALSLSKQMSNIQQELSKYHFCLRGLYGEGTIPLGDFFQLSNQKSLGLKETQMVAQIQSLIPQVINYEKNAREKMLKNSQDILKKCRASQKALCSEKSLSLHELMQHLSLIRLGSALDLLPLPLETANFLFLFSLSANLGRIVPVPMEDEDEDKFRAQVCKKIFNTKEKI